MKGFRLVALVLVLTSLTALTGLGCGPLSRVDVTEIGVPTAAPAVEPPEPGESVDVTWLGVTTLLFDDGETRFMTDGFFSRPTLTDLTLDRDVEPDLAGIERALDRVGVTSLDAVIPVHSHYDHAMDSGEVAKRTGATVIGSSSTANAARGAGLPESQIEVLPDGGSISLGRFTVTLVRSRHAPVGDDGEPPFPGTIEEPLVPPAPISAWKEDRSYSIVVAHPSGTLVVQGSAGYLEGALDGVAADAVFLGIGGLARLGHPYTERYWAEIVGATGAPRVFPVHWDDFTRPYGEVVPFPEAVAGLVDTFTWLRELGPDHTFEWMPFERPVRVLPPTAEP